MKGARFEDLVDALRTVLAAWPDRRPGQNTSGE